MNNYTKCMGSLITDWTEVPLKYILEANSMKVGPFGSQLSGTDFKDEGYWVYNQRTVVDENFDENTVFVDEAKYSSMSAFQVNPGDILITTRGTIGRIARVPNNYYRGIIHPCIIKFKLLENKLLFSLFKHIFNDSDIVTDQLKFMSNATTIDVVYSGTLKKVSIPIPPLSEQKRIADFLDGKCAEIDALVADIQTQIDTLEQYKRSVITETVTKGLNPDVEMNDSGIEWVGMIPDTWCMMKGKYLFTQRSTKGNTISLQLLSPTQRFGVIPQALYEELTGMNAVKLNENVDLSQMKTIHKGDFCISLRSFQGGFEYSEYEGVVSPAYQVFYPTVKVVRGYYKYLFKEKGFIEKMNSYTMTLRDGKNIAFADFGNSYIPLPSFEEQQAISEYLDEKNAEIDTIIDQKKEQLGVLDSYKKSLIYEYVTGKKEVQ